MKNTRQTRLAQYILAALAAGMLSITPVAWALPVQGDTGHTNTTGTSFTTTGSTMDIRGEKANNVMNWQSFSIANGEKVQFDGNNYLNLVRGTSQSEINGALTGGGTIYLINPNGILFGATAQVNVGNLVASTRAISEDGADKFAASGTNPLASSASAAAGDIVNLGKLQTASVTLEGNNITIRNAADITDGTTVLTGEVTVKAAGTIAVGHAVTETTTRSFTINGTAVDKTVHDYAKANANISSGNTTSGYTTSNLAGSSTNAVKESMLVENVYDLQNMDAALGGSYMLAGNIDASETSTWNNGAGFSPVGDWGSQFTGSFDGLNYTINGLYINRSAANNVGLMGCALGGTIQNVGLVDGSITGKDYVGSVVGDNESGTVTNVYNTGVVSGGSDVGGVAGINDGTIENVYNTGAVSGNKYVGGVAGDNDRGTIEDVYNTGAVSGTQYVGGVAGDNDGTIENVYNTGAVNGTQYVGGVAGKNFGTIQNVYNTGAVRGSDDVGGVVGEITGYGEVAITNVYNTGAVSGTSNVGGVVGEKEGNGEVTNAWYATTADAAGKVKINTTSNDVGTGQALADLQTKTLKDYGFVDMNGSTAWRTATDGSTLLVATTPMLKAFQSTALDAAIDHTAVQYGTAEAPLTNIYQASKAVTIDYASLSLPGNVGACIMGNDLTVNNFAPGAGDTSSWSSDTNLTLQNSSGFTVNKNMTLQGTSITLTTGKSTVGTIIDYGRNITPTLNIIAKDIVLDTDRVNTADGGQTTVTLTAAGTVKAGYTPKNTMTASVNGDNNVSVPDYANAAKRDKYPSSITVTGGATLSEGQWIKNVAELQAMGKSKDTLGKKYFLYGDIDASATKTWNQDTTTAVYQGFVPVGNDSTEFGGTFDGLNHTINGLTINRPTTDRVGLFGYSTGTIQNVGLVGGSITGRTFVGGVVGLNSCTYVGGVAGLNSGTITNVYNTGAVSGMNNVGGVAGENSNGTITNVYNMGAVSGKDNDTQHVGGVVGHTYGRTITNAYNTGTVTDGNYVGGVVGFNEYSTIKDVYNTGGVSGSAQVGGVTGRSDWGTIENVYNTGEVSGSGDYVGGVMGAALNGGSITNAYNTGTVRNTAIYTGGVAGEINNNFTRSVYNTGKVIGGSSYVGGVAGYNGNTITNAYNTGAVSGTDYVGGVVGYNGNNGNNDGGITNALWANDLSYETETGKIKPTKAVGNVADTATVQGVTLAAMKEAKTYSGWKDAEKNEVVASEGNKGKAWRIYEGYTTPLLTRFFKGVVTVTGLSNQTVTYNGTTQKADLSGATYDSANIDASHIYLGGSGRNAGTYALVYSDQQGYDLVNTNTLTISPKKLTASLTGKTGDTYVFTRAYDGGTTVEQELADRYTFTEGGVISGDAVSIAANSIGTYNDKNAANDMDVTFSGIALTGADAGNYTIDSTLTGKVGQITKKDITASLNALNGSYVFTREYDGTKTVTQALGDHYSFAANDVVSGDTVSLTAGTGAYTDKNVGNTKEITFGSLVLGGTDAGNYKLTTTSLTGKVGQITARTLTVALLGTNSFSKEYDGTAAVATALTMGTNYQFTGMITKDDLQLAGTGTYTDKKVGDAKEITFGSLALDGADAGNYKLTTTSLTGNVGQITAKELTITLAGNNTFTKEYDGTTTVNQALAGNYTLSGIVGTEKVDIASAGVRGSYTDKNAGDGKQVQFIVGGLTGDDKANYSLTNTTLTGNVGKITKKSLVAELNNGASFAKVYDGTTAVNTALVLDSNYAFAEGDVVTGDTVSIDAAKAVGAYDSKDVGSNKQVNFTNLALTGADAGNYELLNIEMGSTGAGITPKALTGTLASGYSFDKVYDGTTTASLGSGYILNGVAAGDQVRLTAAKGFYDSSAVGDRTVTFSGFSIQDGNYLLRMADSLTGIGRIRANGANNTTNNNTNGIPDHNYNDALTGISSFFGANPSDGYTIFHGTPEDYAVRAVSRPDRPGYAIGTAQAVPAGASQAVQTWYSGPGSITIVNGGITLPKDILLGSTSDTRTVVIKSNDSYGI